MYSFNQHKNKKEEGKSEEKQWALSVGFPGKD